MSGPPRWQRLVIQTQRNVGPRVRALIDREEFTTAASLVQTTRQGLARRVEAPSRRFLHLLNLPAGSDVTRLLNHLASLERQVRDLTKSLEDQQSSGEQPPHDS